MKITEFRQKFGCKYPLSVIKKAYGYTQMQHKPEPSLATASVLYGAKFENRPLRYTGFIWTTLPRNTKVYKVYQVQTETLAALDRLTSASITQDRYTLAALMGENCRFTPLAEFYPEKGQYLGIYGHRNRYVSIVRIQSEKEAENLCKTADVIAQNVMAAYTDYVYKTRRTQEFNKQISPIIKQTSLVGNSLEHFLNERLYMVHNKYGSATLAEFIDRLNKQFNLSIKITEIHIFGL